MIPDFCAFILSHKRADRVLTYDLLKKSGYTGPIYIIIDNEDPTADEYYKHFGEQVIMFDKAAIAKTFDIGDNFDGNRGVTCARNACHGIAKQLGYTYFIELDDDYKEFRYKFTDEKIYISKLDILSLDAVFAALLEYYKSIPALTIAMGQGGDIFGGEKSTNVKTVRLFRKAMNSFICSTDRPFQFVGRINEDVTTYVTLGGRGCLFLTTFQVVLEQLQTQHNKGGLTEQYLDIGTYIKSYYTVMYNPSCVHVGMLSSHHMRLHHKINPYNSVPSIVSEQHRKRSALVEV